MEPEKLTGSEMLQLQKIFANTDIELSDAINKCMDIISDITNYTSVVLGKSSSDNTLLQINIIDLGNNQVVAGLYVQIKVMLKIKCLLYQIQLMLKK